MPKERWDFYSSGINGEPGSIFVNMGLEEHAPIAGQDHLVELRLVMKAPRDDGLSSAEEFDALVAIEKRLMAEIASAGSTTYVGRVTHAGVRDLFWYVHTIAAAEDALRRGMAAFSNYEFDLGSEPDAAWNTYRDYLLPSPRDRQRMSNRAVYEVLQKDGDPLTQPREVDHWAYFANAGARDEFVRRTSNGYALRDTTDPNDIPGNTRYGAQIYRVNVPGDELDQASVELFEIADELSGEYDGWECPVLKASEEPS